MILDISFEDLFYYGYIIPIIIMLLWIVWERSRLKDKYASYLYKDALVLLIPGTALFGVILLAFKWTCFCIMKLDKWFHIIEDK